MSQHTLSVTLCLKLKTEIYSIPVTGLEGTAFYIVLQLSSVYPLETVAFGPERTNFCTTYALGLSL